MKRHLIVAALIAVVLTAVLVPAAAVRADQQSAGQADGPTGVEGTWLVTIPGQNPGEDQHEIAVFAADGVFLFSLAPTRLDGAGVRSYNSSGYGVWTSLGSRRFGYTMMMIVYDDHAGFSGTVKVEAQLTLDPAGTSLTGEERVTVFATDGSVLFAVGPIPWMGSRLTVAPGG